jgi:hypothetical protein
MNHADFFSHQSPQLVGFFLNLLLHRFLEPTFNPSPTQVVERLLSAKHKKSSVEPASLQLVSAKAATDHVEWVFRLTSLQALAFLNDEQKLELDEVRDHWRADWGVILFRCLPQSKTIDRDTEINLARIDAVLLTHLEWMHDVNFEFCSNEQQAYLLLESPLEPFFAWVDHV